MVLSGGGLTLAPGERLNGIQEVMGSIPTVSTTREPSEQHHDLFRWPCVRIGDAAAEAVKKTVLVFQRGS